MSFTIFGLDPRLEKGVAELGFVEPTPIQSATIPVALAGRDVLGSAETGTGKTAAFLLPLLNTVLTGSAPGRRVRALILAPTRELVVQITAQAKALSKYTDLRVISIYGGVGYGDQVQALKRGAAVVVATPGRLLDQVERGHLSFPDLEILVLDEADRMLDVGFLP